MPIKAWARLLRALRPKLWDSRTGGKEVAVVWTSLLLASLPAIAGFCDAGRLRSLGGRPPAESLPRRCKVKR